MNEQTIKRFQRVSALAEIQANFGDNDSIEDTLEAIEKFIELIRKDNE